MKKKHVASFGGILFVLLTASFFFTSNQGGSIKVSTNQFVGDGFAIRLFSGTQTTDTRYVMAGTTNGSTRIVLELPHNSRSGLPTPGHAVIRNDGPVFFRVQKKWLGLWFVSYQTVEFPLPAADLPQLTPENQPLLESSFLSLLESLQ